MNAPAHRHRRGFTLLELLVVLGLVAGLAVVFLSALGGGNSLVALESGQAALAHAVTAARSRALATNTTVRILVRDRADAPDYRRLLVMVELFEGEWRATDAALLPPNVHLLPYRTRIPSGMYPVASEWRNAANSEALHSSALHSGPATFAFDAGAEQWEFAGFTANGTMETGPGSLVLALGRAAAPSHEAHAASPVVMTDPAAVRGIQVSNYGLPRLIDDRVGF